MTNTESKEFLPLNISVLTISDTRTEETDKSGKLLVERLIEAEHRLISKKILTDDIYKIRAQVSAWIADDSVQVILITGGTGMTHRDCTPDAILPLLDREITGFGELFRWVSFQEINTSTIQSRAIGGIANKTLIFCLPGSINACETAWREILKDQLDSRTLPCSFASKDLLIVKQPPCDFIELHPKRQEDQYPEEGQTPSVEAG